MSKMFQFFHLSLFVTILIGFKYKAVTGSPLKIVNGTDAREGEFPYMVQLRRNNFFNCGGSIIAPKWILTAGHCDADAVVYGTNKFHDGDVVYPNTSIKIKYVFTHPKFEYDYSTIPKYDIRLMQLEEAIPFGENAQPIQLAKSGAEVPIHEKGVLSGWGVKSTFGEFPKGLQKINLALQTDAECIQKINVENDLDWFNSTQMLCPENYYNGQCSGDSGSAYVINGTQYGIVSWSIKPCGTSPGAYSRVSYPEFRDWIKEVANV